MSKENYDNYDQEDHAYYAADDSINSETMEKKDPAINQHQDDSSRYSHKSDDYESNGFSNSKDNSDENENDTSDPFFQKNAEIAQDLDDDLKEKDNDDDFDNDANRRTLDESKADEDQDNY